MDVCMYSHIIHRQMIQNYSQSIRNFEFIHEILVWKQYSAQLEGSSFL